MLDIYYSYIKKEQSKDFIKHVFKKYYGYDYSGENLVYNDNGKPYLKDAKYFYNVSHTEGLVMLAISDSEVGIDAEKFREGNFCQVMQKCVTDGERKRITSINDFLCLWTKKESFIKYMGGNAVSDIKHVCFEQDFPTYKGQAQEVNTFSIGLNEHVFSVTSTYSDYDNFTLIM